MEMNHEEATIKEKSKKLDVDVVKNLNSAYFMQKTRLTIKDNKFQKKALPSLRRFIRGPKSST